MISYAKISAIVSDSVRNNSYCSHCAYCLNKWNVRDINQSFRDHIRDNRCCIDANIVKGDKLKSYLVQKAIDAQFRYMREFDGQDKLSIIELDQIEFQLADAELTDC